MPCSRYCAKYFTCIISSNFQNLMSYYTIMIGPNRQMTHQSFHLCEYLMMFSSLDSTNEMSSDALSSFE